MLQVLKLFQTPIIPKITDAMEDPTLYKVITQSDSYCGRISYQDNMIIWLTAGNKPIKILKENIVRITIL